MKLKDYLIDFAKYLLRLLIFAVAIFGPLLLATIFLEPALLLLYAFSIAAFILIFVLK